jgi:protein-tyrosine-phosphatase
MAEGLLKKMAEIRGIELEVSSAGVAALDGYPATQQTIDVMKKEEGVDMSAHQSRRLTLEMLREADKIFVMENFQRDWVLEFSPDVKNKVFLLADKDIPDPIRMPEGFYKNVLGMIHQALEKMVEDL